MEKNHGFKNCNLIILVIYVATMVGIGIHQKTKSAEDFMLGGRSVGSWLTAFSYGTTYFRQLYSSDTQDNLAGCMVYQQHGWESATP